MAGVVQGVGFRPFVARVAEAEGVGGWVRNTTRGVEIEAEAERELLEELVRRLWEEAPGAATVEQVLCEAMSSTGESGFRILESERREGAGAGLPPDLAMCRECRRELFDAGDRRYRYAFLNCTNCGPRYTIVEALPYDRARTTMRGFVMCAECGAEYEDPADRRYHAQPVACPACGPRLERTIAEAAAELRRGKIGAVKGVGGFHLVCVVEAVEELRRRKQRGSQPFALMVADVEAAREFVRVDEQARRLLESAAAPIVLLEKAAGENVGEVLAPGNGYLGVMLAYSPLHALLVEAAGPLVVTSGNRHGEPLATGNEEARERLAELADFWVMHDREIAVGCDDSVVRLERGRMLAVRRGRGYAPMGMKLPVETKGAWAWGAELKAAPAVAQGTQVWMGPHVGDMENLETLEAMEKTGRHLAALFGVGVERVVHDAHPGYLSTQWATRMAEERGWERAAVQHHRAHVASVLAEYGEGPERRVVGVVFDGTGYGDDGAIWGGEFFVGPVAALERRQHLPYVALPGGDRAAKKPALCAFAHAWAAGLDTERLALEAGEAKVARQQLERQWNCFATSSVGRLFDAAASWLGVRQEIRYEG